jgi:hypothetical protein
MPVRSVAVCGVRPGLDIADIQDGGYRSIEAIHANTTQPSLSPSSPHPPLLSQGNSRAFINCLTRVAQTTPRARQMRIYQDLHQQLNTGSVDTWRRAQLCRVNLKSGWVPFFLCFSRVLVIRRNHVYTHYIAQTHSRDNVNEPETLCDFACKQQSSSQSPTARHLVCGQCRFLFRERETTCKITASGPSSFEASHKRITDDLCYSHTV